MKRNLTTWCNAMAVCMLLSAGTGWGADWPEWRGPDRNGVSNETGWLTEWPSDGPRVAWTANVGTGFSAISVSQGRAYTMGNTGKKSDGKEEDVVYCFDAEKGDKIWSYSYPSKLDPNMYEGGPGATPTVDGDRVYTMGKHAELFCFNAKTGEVVWEVNLSKKYDTAPVTWGYNCSALIQGERLFLNAGKTLMALNKANGEQIWSTPTGFNKSGGYASMVPYQYKGASCLTTFQAKGVLSVEAETGKKLWDFPWETSYDLNIADPVVAGNAVLISSGYNKGAALIDFSVSEPKEVWTNRKMRNHFNSCVLYKDHIYGFDESDLKCLSLATGEEIWAHGDLGKGSLMIADGKIIALGDKGTLAIADATPSGYKELASAKVLVGKCWTMPVLANGRIYARNAVGNVVCLDVRKAQ